MSFEQQFTQGIEYRSHFDSSFTLDEQSQKLLESTFSKTSEKAMQEPFFSLRQSLCSHAIEYASENRTQSYSYQCLADSHTFLRACIEQKFVREKYMTLTVGDVSLDGERLFGVTRSTLQECVAQGISTADNPRFHVWLTLADMSVVDLTIMSQLISLGKLPEPSAREQWLNVWRAERKGRFDYHPVLIDDDFLSRLIKPAH